MQRSVLPTGVPLVTSTLGASLTIGRDWASSPEMLPGPLSASPGRDRMIDTGIRMSLTGDLALCTTQGFEILGLTCQSCEAISAVIRPWSKCGSCGQLLTRLTEIHRPPSVLRVDWDTGSTSVEEERSVSAVDSGGATVKQQSHVRGRARGRVFRSSDKSAYTPGGLSSARTGETSGMGSEMSSGGDDISSASGVAGETARVPSAVSEQKEGEATCESEGWEYVGRALPQPGTAPDAEAAVPSPTVAESVARESKSATAMPLTWGPSLSARSPRMDVECDRFSRDDSPPRTAKKAYVENMAYHHFVKRAPDSYLKPGMGNAAMLPKVSRFQRLLSKRVARDFGYEYPFVPESVMDYIEKHRHAWQEEDVWDYLGVPKPCRDVTLSSVFADKFSSCMLHWGYGRYIYKHKVVLKKPDRPDVEYGHWVAEEDGSRVRYPDPGWY